MEINELSKLLIRFYESAPTWVELAILGLFAFLAIWLFLTLLKARREARNLKITLGQRDEQLGQIRSQAKEMVAQLDSLSQVDLHVWERPLAADARSPRNAPNGPAKFIAVCNLKGGVGKTTVTSNVGVGLALRGLRTLLVDIDFQGTLSMRIGGPGAPMVAERRRQGWTSSRLLDPETHPAEAISKSIPVGQADGCRAIVADHTLDIVDFRREAEFYVVPDRDTRLRYREFFFSPEMLSSFDCVLFDCPPRLTTSCINALACSDAIILPTSLGQSESEALPRTFQWFQRLEHLVGHSRKLVLLNAIYKAELTSSELQILQTLETSIAPLRGEKDLILKSRVLDRAEIRRAESSSLPAVIGEGPHGPLFGQLLDELMTVLKLGTSTDQPAG